MLEPIRNPRLIRVFFSKMEAEHAKLLLRKARIAAEIQEDQFATLSLSRLGMRPRFRLFIDRDNLSLAASYFAKLLRLRNPERST